MESYGRGGRRARCGEYEQVLEQGRGGEVAVLGLILVFDPGQKWL